METKTYRGQILLELSLFIVIVVGLITMTSFQTKTVGKEMRKNRIGQSYEKDQNR